MAIKKGTIVGKVVYSSGDGPMQEIPVGPCDIDATSMDATITWIEGEGAGIAALPIDTYTRYLTGGAIKLDDQSADA